MASQNPIHQQLIELFSPWKTFLILFFSVLFFVQATRDIIIDRGIITTIAPLIGILFCSCLLGALLPKFLSNKLLVILFGGIMFIGKLFISLPDNTINYQLYNFGIYNIFLSFPIIFISVFGIVNMINSGYKSDQSTVFGVFMNPIIITVSGILIGFIYNWFLRAIDLIEDLALNFFLSVFFLVVILSTLSQYKLHFHDRNAKKILIRESSERNSLKKIPHASKYARIILLYAPCYAILALSFSYPELYAYLSGLSYQLVIALICCGIGSGIILTSFTLLDPERVIWSTRFKGIYNLLLPISSILTSLFFGLIAFINLGSIFSAIIYFIAGFTIASIMLLAFYELIQNKLLDFEKIIMYTLIITFIIVFGIKGISVERYIPYLEFLISLSFTIPSFKLIQKGLKYRSREVAQHE